MQHEEEKARAIEEQDNKPFNEAVGTIYQVLVTDTHALTAARNAQSDRAILAVIQEMDLKYQVLVRAMPTLFKPGGYRQLFKNVIDEGKRIGMWKGA